MAPIRPWLAGLFAVVCPGLGHIYVGQPRFALPILLLPQIAYMGVLSVAVKQDQGVLPAFQGVVAFMVLFFFAQAIWAVFLARRATEEDRNKRYRSLPIYLSYFFATVFVTQLVSAGPFRPNVLEPFRIAASSMAPTLLQGDHILVTKLGQRNKTWQRGDVVVFVNPQGEDRWVKRVVGLPGDTISVKDSGLVLNGMALNSKECAVATFSYDERPPLADDADAEAIAAAMKEDPIKKDGKCFVETMPDGASYQILVSDTEEVEAEAPAEGDLEVPEGKVFLLGDNRNHSNDSRHFGPVHFEAVLGRAHSVFYSVGPNGKMRLSRIGTLVPSEVQH